MKKSVGLVVLVLAVVFGMKTMAIAQGAATELIDKMKVDKIKKMQVLQEEKSKNYYMLIDVVVKNENDKELILTGNEFNFSICRSEKGKSEKERYAECQKKESPLVTFIGTDKHEDIPLASGSKESPSENSVQFKVDLTGEANVVLERTVALLNFVGDPQTDRTFFIKGNFNLGVKTAQGWTYADQIRVEWQFCPKLQEQLPICNCGDGACVNENKPK